jgi:coproporphyrinogen III oxidase-like Fe-S oxidoreductase
MAPLMNPAPRGLDPLGNIALDLDRPILIGVLPHTFCNPKVRGCGFCTFPHERLAQKAMRRVLEQVTREIEQAGTKEPSLRKRRVGAVYFGGGTANLTPPEALRRLFATLGSTFDLSQSELSLEGVPKYFLLRDGALLDALDRAEVRHRRISMGIQTFDTAWLRRMGRDAFGDNEEVRNVVTVAHERGFTASADLLFNLPGATLERALEDVRSAVEIGFDQICAYSLVLSPELDTEWAQDHTLVQAMPDSAKACTTWLAVRETLLEHGYVQTTLTNFERSDVVLTPRRFVYELASFDPASHDGIGFGPGAISTFTSLDRRRAIKWMNAGRSETYIRTMTADRSAVASRFEYAGEDLKLLHLTRNLARCFIDRTQYKAFFGSDPLTDFSPEFQILEDAKLIRGDEQKTELTPEGMFYADSIAGLLAHQRVVRLRAKASRRAAMHQHMG